MGDLRFETLTDVLVALPGMNDADIPLASAALLIGSVQTPGLNLDRYYHYLDQLGVRVRARFDDLVAAGVGDDAATRLATLKHILADTDGFRGDTETYDDPQNTNLAQVIDRRKGLPIALAILYLHAGQAAGFEVEGLNFPGHFLMRINHGAERLIFDPFESCQILGAPELRALLKKLHGEHAELSADYTRATTNREILIRLQNNVKKRQIEHEDYRGALRTIEIMRVVDPSEFRLLLDAGVLYARVGEGDLAIPLLEDYLTHFPAGHAHRIEAEHLLTMIRMGTP